jgi:ribokinase
MIDVSMLCLFWRLPVLFPGANHTALSQVDLQPYTHILLQNEILFSATLACLSGDQPSREHQKRIRIFNPSPLPDRAKALQIPWKNIDWLLVNAQEGQGLLSSLAGAPASNADEEELTPAWSGLPVSPQTARMLRALSRLPLLSCTSIVCTLGALGVVALIRDVTKNADPTVRSHCGADDEIPMYVPAATVQGGTKDSTGAGDCFTGYFVGGLMRIWDEGRGSRSTSRETYKGLLRECTQVCVGAFNVLFSLERIWTQAAGMCVEKFGAMESMPKREEVLKRMCDLRPGASS